MYKWKVEGAANEDGRTPSIWDTFAHAGLCLIFLFICLTIIILFHFQKDLVLSNFGFQGMQVELPET